MFVTGKAYLLLKSGKMLQQSELVNFSEKLLLFYRIHSEHILTNSYIWSALIKLKVTSTLKLLTVEDQQCFLTNCLLFCFHFPLSWWPSWQVMYVCFDGWRCHDEQSFHYAHKSIINHWDIVSAKLFRFQKTLYPSATGVIVEPFLISILPKPRNIV